MIISEPLSQASAKLVGKHLMTRARKSAGTRLPCPNRQKSSRSIGGFWGSGDSMTVGAREKDRHVRCQPPPAEEIGGCPERPPERWGGWGPPKRPAVTPFLAEGNAPTPPGFYAWGFRLEP